MQHLAKVILKIAIVFLIIFSLAKFTGFLSVEQVKEWLTMARSLSPIYMAALVILLLITDLFVTVPTMTIIALSGYFLGFMTSLFVTMTGLLFVGLIGYGLSSIYGTRVLGLLLKKEHEQNEAIASFHEHGFMMIVLARAVPMLPEISAYLAGATKMPFGKFILAWFINILPYSLFISYAGSISSIDDPNPALFTAIGISATLWIGWYLFNQHRKAQFKANQ